MDLLTVMRNRRSVRTYSGEPVSDEALDMILRAGLLAPSSRNVRPVRFITVRNRETLEKLSQSRPHGTQMLAKADCAVVVLADTTASDVWTEDCCIAMTHMHLMAESLGIGSCWIQGRLRPSPDGRTAEAYDRDVLGFPETWALEAILSLGMPEAHPAPRCEDDFDKSVIHSEHFEADR